MRLTKLGLPDNSRQVSVEELQQILVDSICLRLAVKQAHWTVQGPHFHQLHVFFDSLVEPLDEEIDTLAERVATLGGQPDGTAHSVSTTTRIEQYPADATAGSIHLEQMGQRFASLGNTVRLAIDTTDEAGDADTADILTGLSRFLDKSLWFIEAHTEVRG